MLLKSNFAVAWSLALAPVFLFIPAFVLAGMGPCSFEHPFVMVSAFVLFIGLELAAVPCFVKAARSAGKAISAMFGIGLALLLLFFSVAFEFTIVGDYL